MPVIGVVGRKGSLGLQGRPLNSHLWTLAPELCCQALLPLYPAIYPPSTSPWLKGLSARSLSICPSPTPASSRPHPWSRQDPCSDTAPPKNVASLAKPRVWTHGDRKKGRSSFCVAPDGLGSLREFQGATTRPGRPWCVW